MTINELGKRELDKLQRKEKRNKDFAIVAAKFAKLAQQACTTGKPCSIVAWSNGKTADGEIFAPTNCNPYDKGTDIIEKRTGQEQFDDDGDNPRYPKYEIIASYSVASSSGYSGYRKFTWMKLHELWPCVSTWQGKIINNALGKIMVPNHVFLSVHFMDCRGVRGICRKGARVADVIH